MKKVMSIPYLSWKSMKYNKRKTIFLILTVSLAVCLMTVFLQYLYSSRQRNEEIAALDSGFYYAEYRNLSEWQLSQLENYDTIREVIPVQNEKGADGVRIILKSNINCKDALKDIEFKFGIQDDQVQWNIQYLDLVNIGAGEILQILCIIAGLFFISAIVIYNIYNIYLIQDIKIFGTMKAAGFDSAQLKRFLNVEGVITGGIGSFLGVVLGRCVSSILIPVLGDLENTGENLRVRITFGIIILSFVSGLVIVFIGSQKPIRTAVKKSIIETIRYDPECDRKKIKKKRNDKKQITLWDFCKINLRRNHKKNCWVILSLNITGILFLVSASVIDSMNIDNLLKLTIRGDYSLGLIDEAARNKGSGASLDVNMLEEIQRHDGIEELHTIMYDRLLWTATDAKKYTQLTEEFKELGIGYEDIDSIVYGYDDAYIKMCLQVLGNKDISLHDMEKNNYVIIVQNGISDFCVGDTIHLKVVNGTSKRIEEFKIAGILKNNITYRGYSGAGNDFILHQRRFETLHLDNRIQRISITVKQSEKEKVKAYLEELTRGNPNMEWESYDELKEEYMVQKKALEKSSYSILVFLFCISIVNLINTSLSNILSQKRELGMLEAIGLTEGQENQLLQMEGFVLVFSSGIIACFIGIPLGYAGFYLFSRSATYAIYKIPLMQCFVLLAGYIIIHILTVKIIQYQLNKNSVIDKISQQNL